MNDDWKRFEALLEGRVNNVCLLNEPLDSEVNFAVEEPKAETATERARRLWFADPV
jgi:hypothetical protein